MSTHRSCSTRWLTLGAALALIAGESRAGDYDDPGFYVSLAGLSAFEVFGRVPDGVDVSPSLGAKIKVGYRFTPMLSAEADANFLTGFKIDIDDAGSIPGGGNGDQDELVDGELNINAVLFTANARLDLPSNMVLLTPRLRPFAVVGLGVMWGQLKLDTRANDGCSGRFLGWWCDGVFGRLGAELAFASRFSAGVEYFVSDEWALVVDADFVVPTGKLKELRYISLGWGVRLQF